MNALSTTVGPPAMSRRGPVSTGPNIPSLVGSEPQQRGMGIARSRLVFVVILFCAAFFVMAARTVELSLKKAEPMQVTKQHVTVPPVQFTRADILDRNGEVLATNLGTSSLYAYPARIRDPEEAARKLVSVLPNLSEGHLIQKLSASKGYIRLQQRLSPRQKWAVNALGIPAFEFAPDEERIYPHGRLAVHALGAVNYKNEGISGAERYFERRLSDAASTNQALRLSIDSRVQYALADELESAMRVFQAIGAAGVVMDVNTGEVIAMVSLPDFDPNTTRGVSGNQRFNRVTQGVYELGSVFKTFTLAAALDDGVVDFSDGYDASLPMKVGGYTIRDDHPKGRYLTVPEIYAYSSNIGTARMALDLGTEQQQRYLSDFGLLRAPDIELVEVGAPLFPARWRKTSTVTISYGHGISVSPLALVTGIASMVNGGRLLPATLIRNSEGWRQGKRVIAPDTSRKIRQLMRMVVTKGTGGRADAVGYRVGGKTGTAEKASNGGYDRKALISSFVGVYPMDDPQYVVFALLDEPKGTKATYGFSSGGWVAAPVVKNVILRTAPLLGVAPKTEDEGLYKNVALRIEE